MLKRLKKNNDIIYVDSFPPERTRIEYIPINSLKEFAKYIKSVLTYGLGVGVLKNEANAGIPCILDKFITKNTKVINYDSFKNNWNSININITEKYNINLEVLYLDHELVSDDKNNNYLCTNDSSKVLDQILIEISTSSITNNIGYKQHPGHKFRHYSSLKNFQLIDSYIPAEYLFNENIKFVISPWSFSLVNSSKYIKSISIIKLLPFKSEKHKNNLIKYLEISSNQRILFPNTSSELKNILKT